MPSSNELLKKDESSPSAEELGTAKKGMSKKDRRAARRQQWMKSTLQLFQYLYILLEWFVCRVKQLPTPREERKKKERDSRN